MRAALRRTLLRELGVVRGPLSRCLPASRRRRFGSRTALAFPIKLCTYRQTFPLSEAPCRFFLCSLSPPYSYSQPHVAARPGTAEEPLRRPHLLHHRHRPVEVTRRRLT